MNGPIFYLVWAGVLFGLALIGIFWFVVFSAVLNWTCDRIWDLIRHRH